MCWQVLLSNQRWIDGIKCEEEGINYAENLSSDIEKCGNCGKFCKILTSEGSESSNICLVTFLFTKHAFSF